MIRSSPPTNISDSIIAELIQAPPPPPPLPEKTLLPPPALPVLIDNASVEQNNASNEISPLIDKDKQSENRLRESQKPESNSLESSTHDSSRRESKYANNPDHRPKKTTSRFSNPPTTKIPSLLDLPSENPFANNEMPSNRSTDSFFHNDDISSGNMNRYPPNQSNRFGNDQGPQNSKYSDGMKDSTFGYRFGDNKSNWNKNDQPQNRFTDEQSFSNQFAGPTSRDNFGNDSKDRFTPNMGQSFANNPNRFGQEQLTNASTNKFPSNSSQFSRFGQEQTKSNSNSQESFGPTAGITDAPNNLFPKDQDDRILSNTTFPSRFVQDAPKSFTNPFAQNVPNKSKSDEIGNNFPVKDLKVETDAVRHSMNDNQRFAQNQTPNNFLATPPPPPNEQRNIFPNQTMNRFGNTNNQDGFGRATTRFDDFQNSFTRPTFNMPPMNQATNFIPSQPNLQQPPPNFQSNNHQSSNMVIPPFSSTAFGMNFTTPPPVNSLLHTIPQPLPMSLNKIPPPKDLDLKAIPEPQVNLGSSNYASITG